MHLLSESSKQGYAVGTNYQEEVESAGLPGVAQLGSGGARSCMGGIAQFVS